ncbi:hypothetical protein CY0110_18272 [Crocosphaera chwakensis CCY0110]|uniref:Uncharacterized protein n=1 Tax=Crocosphaera chwakensis CCY0110 TaxID=391612 RepID=A3IIY6_9CHRO|nr:hypothetical protein CY0110_18272 [Crocosphaera chwakensis CCY0110]
MAPYRYLALILLKICRIISTPLISSP